ncbi:MAG TPA: LPS export ABC transporter permease LptG [bacterium]
MRILDRYILRRFCVAMVFAIAAFVLIVIFVDMVGNLAKFIDRDVPKTIILRYYLVYIPYIWILVMPIAMLLASIFSIGYMARQNELVAIKSVGVSLYRILSPPLLFSILVSLLAFAIGEQIVPVANQQKSEIETTYLEPASGRGGTRASNIFWRDKIERRIFISQFDQTTQMAQKVSIQQYRGNQIIARLDAPRMQWQDSTWALLDGYQRIFTDDTEEAAPFELLHDRDIDITPDKIMQTRVQPEDMSYSELKFFTNEVKRNGGDPNRWLVDLYFKTSIPFANFIMVLFGAPLASNKKRSGAIFGVLTSLLISFIYYGFNKFIQTLGQNGTVEPLLAAWVANAVFLAAGIWLMVVTRK